MKSSYSEEDVKILLKDISGLVEPLPASVREKKIQSGTHYCEMLPLEYKPSEKYMEAYENALKHYSGATAQAAGILAEKLYEKKGDADRGVFDNTLSKNVAMREKSSSAFLERVYAFFVA